MLEISNVKVYDLEESVIACRNAFRLIPPEPTKEEFEKSLETAKKLVKTPMGCGEQTFLCGIRVSFDVKYPGYWTPEFQRYHFADIVTSSSKMHKLLKMDMDKCFNKYVTNESVSNMKRYIEEYNKIASEIIPQDVKNTSEHSKRLYEAWMRVVSNCPMGIELFMRVSTNYLQLKTIYNQRRYHKLKEDWGAFCKFIEELPYSKELILASKDPEIC